jgi:hypothetical protein
MTLNFKGQYLNLLKSLHHEVNIKMQIDASVNPSANLPLKTLAIQIYPSSICNPVRIGGFSLTLGQLNGSTQLVLPTTKCNLP